MDYTPSTLDRVRAFLTGVPPSVYTTRRAARRDARSLRKRLAEARARVEESAYGLGYGFGDPFGRRDLYPGIELGFATGSDGTVADRKGGRDLPFFWDEIDLRNFRWASRVLCDSNPFAIGILDTLVDFHIGLGFGWQSTRRGVKKGPYPTGIGEADPDVERSQSVLDAWRDRVDWPLRSQEAFKRSRRDGEVFVRLGVHERGSLPWTRFVEPEQVGPPSGSDTEGPWSFGILNRPGDVETVLAYFVRDPRGDGTRGTIVTASPDVDVDEVADLSPAAFEVVRGFVLHLKRNVDSSVKRGLPDFFPVHEDLDRVSKLLKNMAEVAALLAAIAWVQEYATATTSQVQSMIQQGQDYERPKLPPWGPGGSGSTLSVKHYEAGAVIHTDSGKQYKPGPVAEGIPGFVQVEQAVLRGVAVRFGFPEFMVSADASNNNYASILASGAPLVRRVEREQQVWGAFERRIAGAVLLLAGADSRRVDVETTPPAVAMEDKSQETSRRSTMQQAGVLSITTWQLQEGLDPKHEAENQKAEKEREAEAQPPQQPPGGGPGGLGGPPPGGGPPPEGGGGEFSDGNGGLFGEGVLSEAGREGLEKKVITNKAGKKQTVYVRAGEEPAAAEPAANPDHPAWVADHPEVAGVLDAFAGATGRAKSILATALENAGVLEYDEATDSVRPAASAPETEPAELAQRLAAGFADQAELGHTPEEVAPVAAALKSLGAEPVGDAGGFNGAYHEDVPGLPTGSPVRVVRPGWSIPGEGGRTVVILKAKVAPVSKAEARVREAAPGPPPRPGLVWNDATKRWRHPHTGTEHEHGEPVGHEHAPDYRPPTRFSTPNKALPNDARPVLDAEQSNGVENYGRWHYKPLNSALITGKPVDKNDAEVVPTHAHLQAAFAMAKPFDKPVPVFRGVGSSDATRDAIAAKAAAAIKSGQPITLPGYQSTTTDPDRKFVGRVQMKIAAVHGIDVRPYANSPSEEELLLDHNSRFRVKSATQDAQGVLHLELEQLPPDVHSLSAEEAKAHAAGASAELVKPAASSTVKRGLFRKLFGG